MKQLLIFIASFIIAYAAQAQANPFITKNELQKSSAALFAKRFVLSPDTIPVFTNNVACTRDSFNNSSVFYAGSISVTGSAGTDTSILKKTVNGLPYIRFTLDSSQSCNVHRSELSPKAVFNNILADSIVWIGETKLLPATWTKDSTPVIISQVHGGSTYYTDANSPPFDLEVRNDSLFATVAYNTGTDSVSSQQNATRVATSFFLYKLTFGTPFSFVAQMKFSAYPKKDGFVRIWINDRLALSYTGALGYHLNNANYYKTGIYKWLFHTGTNSHVAAGVQSAKIIAYVGDAKYGNGNSRYEDVRSATLYTAPAPATSFVAVPTYAAMIAAGVPAVMTTYKVTADENYSGATTEYQYWPDGDIINIVAQKTN